MQMLMMMRVTEANIPPGYGFREGDWVPCARGHPNMMSALEGVMEKQM